MTVEFVRRAEGHSGVESTGFMPGWMRQGPGRLSVIVVGGALAMSSTSSVGETTVWEAPFVHEADGTSGGLELTPTEVRSTVAPAPTQATGRAIAELRRRSGLTWEQLSQLFGVSRRSLHFWASGKPLNASNEEFLLKTLAVVRLADQGGAARTRSALLEPVDGVSPFDLLVAQRFDESKTLLGQGASVARSPRRELSALANSRRRPQRPEELTDARQDRIHLDLDEGRPARAVRVEDSGTG